MLNKAQIPSHNRHNVNYNNQHADNVDTNKFSFLSNQIYCKTHKNQPAKTVCLDCKTFCCMSENCGQSHIYHSIENIDYLVNQQILPMIHSLGDINDNNKKNKNNNSARLGEFKNNLKQFAITEKKNIDDEYRNILDTLQTVYKNYMEDINEFISGMDLKFDLIHEKMNQHQDKDFLDEINSNLENLLKASNGISENFIIDIAKAAKGLNTKIKSIANSSIKFDFEKEIAEIKSSAEKEHQKLDKIEYLKGINKKLENDIISMGKNRQKNRDSASLSKMKRMVSVGASNLGVMSRDNSLGVDLDIFVRNLYDTINKVRLDVNEGLKILDDYLEMINTNDENALNQTNLNDTINNVNNRICLEQNSPIQEKLSFIYQYLINLGSDYKNKVTPFEWDNDLSNAAEDYFKTFNGKIERDPKNYQFQMQDIILKNYYAEHENIFSITYHGSPNINKIIMGFLINELYWSAITKQNIIFNLNYNNIGICGISSVYNKLILIINFSYLKK